MKDRDRIEFSYHVIRFLVTNFLKLYYKNNKVYDFDEALRLYFNIFPKNKNLHIRLIKKILNKKNKKFFKNSSFISKNVRLFVIDFELQFKELFFENYREIIFARHGKTSLNKKDLFIGRNTDVSISKQDKAHTELLKNAAQNADLIITSPSKRCLETSELIINRKPIIDNRLNEIDYGKIEGKNIEYLSKNYPEILENWKKGIDQRFPEGENNLDVYKRIESFLKEIKQNNSKKIIVITHNVFLRCLIGSYFKIPQKYWYKINISYLEPIKFIIAKNKRIYINLDDYQIENIFKDL